MKPQHGAGPRYQRRIVRSCASRSMPRVMEHSFWAHSGGLGSSRLSGTPTIRSGWCATCRRNRWQTGWTIDGSKWSAKRRWLSRVGFQCRRSPEAMYSVLRTSKVMDGAIQRRHHNRLPRRSIHRLVPCRYWTPKINRRFCENSSCVIRRICECLVVATERHQHQTNNENENHRHQRNQSRQCKVPTLH